jgi:hypothetical protein
MNNILHIKSSMPRKADKLKFKKIVHLYDDEEIMETFSEHQVKKKLEVIKKKNLIGR